MNVPSRLQDREKARADALLSRVSGRNNCGTWALHGQWL